MQVLVPSEAYLYGWQITDNLANFTDPTFEEVYEEDTKAQTIRKIARTQSPQSLWWTRHDLTTRLIAQIPARKNSPNLPEVVDEVLRAFYYGDDPMPATANSLKHAQQLEREQFEKQQKINILSEIIAAEVLGLPISEAQFFFRDILVEKYNLASFSESDQDEIYNRVFSDHEALVELEAATRQEASHVQKGLRDNEPCDMRDVSLFFNLDGVELFETALFRVDLLATKKEQHVLFVTRKADGVKHYADFKNGKFNFSEQRKVIAALLPDPKNIEKFEEKIAASLSSPARS